jgi:hypothetical protein
MRGLPAGSFPGAGTVDLSEHGGEHRPVEVPYRQHRQAEQAPQVRGVFGDLRIQAAFLGGPLDVEDT